MPGKPLLQVALDFTSTTDALSVLERVYPYVNVVEVGTPLVIEEGLAALRTLKEKFPDRTYVADLKIMDAGYLEASSAFRSGADWVTVLAVADDRTVRGALDAAQEHEGQVVADLIQVSDLPGRAQALEAMGVPILCVHTACDRQGRGIEPLAELRRLRPIVRARIAVAGGLGESTVPPAAQAGADILVVGSGIAGRPDPREAARRLLDLLKGFSPCSP
ncbi:MAG: orotidine 5'-phosphate decarboxylase [Planctomycetes bacterium]|nr:orotidine 5'-phosphate decarboxylase [Planctomycetota bacterium]